MPTCTFGGPSYPETSGALGISAELMTALYLLTRCATHAWWTRPLTFSRSGWSRSRLQSSVGPLPPSAECPTCFLRQKEGVVNISRKQFWQACQLQLALPRSEPFLREELWGKCELAAS